MSGSRHPHGMAAMELSGNSTSCLGFGMAGSSAWAWSTFFGVSALGDPRWMVNGTSLAEMDDVEVPPPFRRLNLYIIYYTI